MQIHRRTQSEQQREDIYMTHFSRQLYPMRLSHAIPVWVIKTTVSSIYMNHKDDLSIGIIIFYGRITGRTISWKLSETENIKQPFLTHHNNDYPISSQWTRKGPFGPRTVPEIQGKRSKARRDSTFLCAFIFQAKVNLCFLVKLAR